MNMTPKNNRLQKNQALHIKHFGTDKSDKCNMCKGGARKKSVACVVFQEYGGGNHCYKCRWNSQRCEHYEELKDYKLNVSEEKRRQLYEEIVRSKLEGVGVESGEWEGMEDWLKKKIEDEKKIDKEGDIRNIKRRRVVVVESSSELGSDEWEGIEEKKEWNGFEQEKSSEEDEEYEEWSGFGQG